MLILAAVSIATLTGKNGILTQAQNSQRQTERTEIIERAKLDITKSQIENKGNLTEEQLNEILTSNDYATKGTLSDNGESSILDKTLTTQDGKYQIPVKEIYNGKFSSLKIIHFTVNGEEYETKENVTWEEFLNSQECQGISKGSHYGYIGKNFEFMGGANRRKWRIPLFRQ